MGDIVYFIYDGVNSQDYGYCIASFDNGGGVSGINTDSQRNFNQVMIAKGALHPFTCATYDDSLEMNFSIIKDPCQVGNGSEVLSVDDMRFLKRWLNRPSAHKFFILDREYERIYWEGSCNIEEAIYSGERVGVNVTLKTNRPYGLFEDVVISGNADSDEPLPVVELYNDNNADRKFVVLNCALNETITIDNTLQISSDKAHPTLAQDCNYKFPMLYTKFDSDINYFYSSIPTDITISFKPVAKVVIV